jgi:hypothetical protein
MARFVDSQVKNLTQAPSQPKTMLAEHLAPTAASPLRSRVPKLSSFGVALLLFVGYWLANVTLYPVSPTRSDFVPAKISAKGRAQRVADYFYNAENPDIILLGSSLIFRASFESDKVLEHLPVPSDQNELWEFKRKHVESQHFEKLLKQTFGKPVSAYEFGIPASMVSDHREFVGKLSLFNKTPKVVICTLAPRDFFDNVYKDPKETTGWEQLSTCYPNSMWPRHPKAMLFYLSRRCAPIYFLCQKADALKCRAFTYRYYFEQTARTDLLTLFNQSTLPSTVAPVQRGTSKQAPLAKVPAHKYPDLDCYQFSYNPPDYKELECYADELRALAKECKRAGYFLVLVDMPVTPENRCQMMPEALSRYRKTLADLSKTCEAQLIVPEKGTTYDAPDFGDSVHLTAPGGDKFFRCIVKSLFENPQIRAKLMQSRS